MPPFAFVKGVLWPVMNLITNMMTYDELIDFVDEDKLSKKLVFFFWFHALRSIYREKITARIIG